LPSQQEILDLCLAVTGLPYPSSLITAGVKLKSTSGWGDYNGDTSGNGTDDFGFSALPGGWIKEGVRQELNHTGCWWTNSRNVGSGAPYFMKLFSSNDTVDARSMNEYNQCSVRFVID
jgi:uncharacterized protein (TIGR02145 family)